MDKFVFKNDNSGENVRNVLKRLNLLEKKVGFLLNKLKKCEIENKEMKLEIDNLRKENSIFRENIRYSLKLIEGLLNKFDELGI